jgi:hypothetical protein
MDSPQQLAQLETLCQKLYTSTDATERRQAESALSPFSTNPDLLGHCKYALQSSKSVYVQNFAASSILRLLLSKWNSFTVQIRKDLSRGVFFLICVEFFRDVLNQFFGIDRN